MLLIESSSEPVAEIAEEELDDDIVVVAVAVVFDFLRCVNSETSLAPRPFFDLLDGALFDRVNVEHLLPSESLFVTLFRLPARIESVAILSRSMSPV